MLLELISKLYINKQKEILNLLQKYKLLDAINPVLEQILDVDFEDFEKSKKKIGLNASVILTRVNLIIQEIESVEDKILLEYIISDIFKELIVKIVNNTPEWKDLIFYEISESLKITCEVNSWDFHALNNKIQVDLGHTFKVNSNPSILSRDIKKTKKAVHYIWNKTNEELEILAYDLKDKKVIKSVKEFKLLFATPTLQKVRMNLDCLDFVIILFDELYCMKKIAMNGSKGQFLPLKLYCVDFENKELIKKEPKRIKEAIKKNISKYAHLKNKVLISLGEI